MLQVHGPALYVSDTLVSLVMHKDTVLTQQNVGSRLQYYLI